jgi:hypothetical protein
VLTDFYSGLGGGKRTNTLKIRGFGGIDQSGDANDMPIEPVCSTKDGYGFDVDDNNLKRLTPQNYTALQLPAGYTPGRIFLFARHAKRDLYCAAVKDSDGSHKVFTLAIDGSTPTTWTDVTGALVLASAISAGVSYQNDSTPIFVMVNGSTAYKATGDGANIALLSTDTLPAGFAVELHQARIWIGNCPSAPDTVFFSSAPSTVDPAYGPTDWIQDVDRAGYFSFPTWDGDAVQAIVSFNDSLIVFKKRSTWRLYGATYDQFGTEQINADVGATARETVAVGEGAIYVGNKNGIYRFDGVNFTLFKSDEINDLYNVNFSTIYYMTWLNGYLYVYGGTTADPTRSYCYKINTKTGKTSMVYNGLTPATRLSCVESPYIDKVYYTSFNGVMYFTRGLLTLIDTSGAMKFVTPTTDMGSAAYRKRISKMTVTGKGGSFKITPIVDGLTKTAKTVYLPTLTAVDGEKHTYTNRLANSGFSGTTSWSSSSAALTAATGTLSCTSNGSSVIVGAAQATTQTYTTGDKWYVRSKVSVTNAVSENIFVALNGSGGGVVNAIVQATPANGTIYDRSAIATLPTGSGTVTFVAYSAYVDAATANGKVTRLAQPLIINLTAMYGTGLEPNLETCDLLYPYAATTSFDYGFTPKDGGVVRVPLSVSGKRVAFQFENVNASPVDVSDMEIEYSKGAS